jgi:hypothetical protein
MATFDDDEDPFLPSEPEVLSARQGFFDAQAELAGTPVERKLGLLTCGWYGTALSQERGSFVLVNQDGPLADAVGERLRLTYRTRSVYVYCFGADSLDWDLHVTRRVYTALELLCVDKIDVIVEIVAS